MCPSLVSSEFFEEMASSQGSHVVLSNLSSSGFVGHNDQRLFGGAWCVIGQEPTAEGDLFSSSEQTSYQHKATGGHLYRVKIFQWQKLMSGYIQTYVWREKGQ